jgi:hypothetical protein
VVPTTYVDSDADVPRRIRLDFCRKQKYEAISGGFVADETVNSSSIPKLVCLRLEPQIGPALTPPRAERIAGRLLVDAIE